MESPKSLKPPLPMLRIFTVAITLLLLGSRLFCAVRHDSRSYYQGQLEPPPGDFHLVLFDCFPRNGLRSVRHQTIYSPQDRPR